MNPRYIVVEGAIGSGKTALSRRLAEHFSALLLSENPDHNPFLMKFYSNVSNNGLAAELFFLTRRAESVNIIETNARKAEWLWLIFCRKKTVFLRLSF